nr:nonstructural polyprotein [Dicistroviridae sp.]
MSPINFQKLISDLEYSRNHPFFSDWKDWQEIAYNYHSPQVRAIQRKINKGKIRSDDCTDTTLGAMSMSDEVYFGKLSHRQMRYQTNNPKCFWEERFNEITVRIERILGNCSCFQKCQVDKECNFFKEHVQAHLIGFMWAYCEDISPPKKWRKYYIRFERLILSLNVKRLRYVTLDMFANPDKYYTVGKHLLREFYRRGYLDGVIPNDFCEKAEALKYVYPRAQGATTQQCHSGGSMISDEMIKTAEAVFQKFSMEDLFLWSSVKQQGLFNIDVTHKFKDVDLIRLRDLIQQSRDTFCDSVETSLTMAGSKLTVMFVTAGTVALLSKIAMGIASDVVYKLLHLIYSLMFHDGQSEKSYRVVQQSGNGEVSIPFLPSMILQHVISPPSKILNTLWKNNNFDLIMRRLGYLGDPKVDAGLDRVIVWIKQMFSRVMRWYSRTVLRIETPEDIESDSHPVINWNTRVAESIALYNSGGFHWDETSWSIVQSLYMEGLKFTRSKEYRQYHNNVWRMLTTLGNLLEKFKLHNTSGQVVREPPVTIYMAGESGEGKSTVTYPLCSEILKGIYVEEQKDLEELKKTWQTMVYCRNAEQEFWDGYAGQLITVFDDFNQVADSSANPSLELFEIIRASNIFPYPLHMAAIEQKANTVFCSKIILVSTNQQKPKTASLNFPDALYRRFDICVRCKRSKDSIDNRSFRPDAYTFEIYDMWSGATQQIISYNELVALCVDKYFERRRFVASVQDYITTQVFTELPKAQGFRDDVYNTVANLPSNMFGKVDSLAQQMLGVRKMREDALPPIQDVDYANAVNEEIVKQLSVKSDEHRYWKNLEYLSNKIKSQYVSLMEGWADFKKQHAYWAQAIKIVGWLFAALVFLRAFMSISELFKKKKERVLMTENEFLKTGCPERRLPLREGYNNPQIRQVKAESIAEGYNNPAIKTVKAESTLPILTPRVARVEAVDFDPKTGMPVEQGIKDLNAAEILLAISRRNLYKMYESSTMQPIGHVFFLRGKICVMPKHFMSALQQAYNYDEKACVYFKSVFLTRAFECHVEDLLRSKIDYQSPDESHGPVFTRDLVAMEVSTSIVHPDAVAYFCSRGSLSTVDRTSILLPVMAENTIKGSDRPVVLIRFREGRSALKREEVLTVGDDNGREVRWIRDAWRYEADTQPTECGSPLIVRNSLIQSGKICGFHIAGMEGTGEGWATPFYQEDALHVISSFPEEKGFYLNQRTMLKEFPVEQGQVPEKAEFLRMGSLEKPIYQPGVTMIRKSQSHGRITDVKTTPCALKPVIVDNGKFDPRSYRLQRLGNVPQAIPRDIIENAKEALLDDISETIAASEDSVTANFKAVYTFEEAVCGIDGEPYINAVKRNTSPGFPFVQMGGFQQRKNFFGDEMQYDLDTPQCKALKLRVDDIIEAARRGEVLDHYFIDTLKDERKPIHKAHKTRLFSAGPLDYLIVCKMYFNGIVALLQKQRNWSHVSVGTNPYSEDWGEIVRVLRRKSENMIAGDFEGFDASQHQLLLEAAGEILVELSRRHLKASPEDCRVMRVLLVSLFNSLHITGKEVYQWTHSLPSGHYLTAPINSVFVNLAFGSIWQTAYGVSYLCARSFWKECGIVAYGDDHIVSVPTSRIEVFNQLTIPELFKKIGLSYTMEDKDASAEYPSRSIFEVSYLRRSFRKDELTGRWLAPLSLDVVLETPMWMHKTPDPRNQTIENLDWALKELSLHDHKTWYKWAPVMHQEQERLGYYTPFKHHFEVRNIVLDQDIEM